MSLEPPSQPLDLLVVGALTVDRFADGSSAPGGSVLHIARAAARRGSRVGVITTVGPEPEAQAGLDELRYLGALIDVSPHSSTWRFRHETTASGRRLAIERAGGTVRVSRGVAEQVRASARLFAPVAAELDPSILAVWEDGQPSGAILQGWLRAPIEGAEVVPVPLAAVSEPLRSPISRVGTLFASREDLASHAATPLDQLAELRAWAGPDPALVLTDGVNGIWVQAAGGGQVDHLRVPQVMDADDAIGAGDVLAAFVTVHRGSSRMLSVDDVVSAMRDVADELEARPR